MPSAPDAVLDLVDRFDHNIDRYRSPAYNETRVRIEFVDPFFTALGWDVANTKGTAPQYQEVIHQAILPPRLTPPPQSDTVLDLIGHSLAANPERYEPC